MVRSGRRAPNRNVKGHFLERDRSAGAHAGKRDRYTYIKKKNIYIIITRIFLIIRRRAICTPYTVTRILQRTVDPVCSKKKKKVEKIQINR